MLQGARRGGGGNSTLLGGKIFFGQRKLYWIKNTFLGKKTFQGNTTLLGHNAVLMILETCSQGNC